MLHNATMLAITCTPKVFEKFLNIMIMLFSDGYLVRYDRFVVNSPNCCRQKLLFGQT